MNVPDPHTPSSNSMAPRGSTLPICNSIAEIVPHYKKQIDDALDRFDYGAAERAVGSLIAKVDTKSFADLAITWGLLTSY